MDTVFRNKVKNNKHCVDLANKLQKYRLQYVLVKSDEFLPLDMKEKALTELNMLLNETRHTLCLEMEKVV